MKTNKVIKIITIILLIVIITIASIFGIYKLKDYKVVNLIPQYKLGAIFTDARQINLSVDSTVDEIIYDSEGNEILEKEEGIEYTEANGYKIEQNKTNPDEVLTVENYKKAKEIVKTRLKKLGVDEYKIDLDESNGNINIRIQEDKNNDKIINDLLIKGNIEIKDAETEEVLITADMFEKADVMYSQQTETETAIFLQIKFNKEGSKKIEELSKIYVENIVEKTNENGEVEETTESKEAKIYMNDELIEQITLDKIVLNKMLYIGVGSGSDAESLQRYADIAENYVHILNSGTNPIVYTQENYVEKSTITQEHIKNGAYVVLAIIALWIIVFVVVLKTKGILASILQIGFIGLLLIALRYTNVKITLEGIFGILIGAIINCLYLLKIFKNMELDFIKNVTVKFTIKMIPIYVIAIILSFNKIANVYSLGMTIVWSAIIMYLYNLTLTKKLVDTIKE